MSVDGSLDRGQRLAGQESLLAIGVLRAVLVPIIAVGSAVSTNDTTAGFTVLLVLAGAYSIGQLICLRMNARPRWLRIVTPVVDVALLLALADTSGGSSSDVRKAFILLPLAAAFVTRPMVVAGWALISVLGYLGLSVLESADGQFVPREAIVHAVYLAWGGTGAVVLSLVLSRSEERIAELAGARSRLVDRALGAEAQERQRLAEALHDAPIQNLLAARMELADARAGDPVALDLVEQAIDETVAQLRATVFHLHPQVLESAGLEAAVSAVAREQARHGGFEISLDIAEELRLSRDALLFTFARELLTNAARHANATHVDVNVFEEEGQIVLEVIDDGQGMAAGQPQRAQADGHIGLAAAAERARARGGRLRLRSTLGEGTRVRIALPHTDTVTAANLTGPTSEK